MFLDHLQHTNKIDRATYSFLVEAYAYTAILVEFSMIGSPGAWRIEDAGTLLSIGTSGMHIGCASSLFVLIPVITALANRLVQERYTWNLDGTIPHDYSVGTRAIYELLLKQITNWDASLYTTDTVLVLLGRIYQKALLLCLQVTFHQHRVMDSELAALVHDTVEDIITLFSLVPLDSSVNSTTCWLLVVTGSCAKTAKHQQFIKERLENMYERMSFHSLIDTRDFLDQLWFHCASLPSTNKFMSPIDIQNEMLRQKRLIVFV